MPILAYGTAMGWISPNKALLMGESSPSDAPLSEEDVSWMASIMFIFAPIAVFIYGVAADKFGRKNALLCASLPISVSIIICQSIRKRLFWVNYETGEI